MTLNTSKLSLARNFAEGNVTPGYKAPGLMSLLCMPFSSPKLIPRGITAKNDKRHRRSTRARGDDYDCSEKQPLKTSFRDGAKSAASTRSRVESGFWDIELVFRDNSCAPTPYLGMENDRDLWLADGDCDIFFAEAGSRKPSIPSLRVRSDAIRRADMLFLNQLLDAGKRRRRSRHSSFAASNGSYASSRPRSSNAVPLSVGIPPYQSSYVTQFESPTAPKLPSPLRYSAFGERNEVSSYNRRPSWAVNTAYISENLEEYTALPGNSAQHEIWFTIPAQLEPQERRKYKLALRNLLAIIHNKPIVGSDIMAAILGVQEVVVALSAGKSNIVTDWPRRFSFHESRIRQSTNFLAAYMRDFGFDDIRSDLIQALKLLAWSELPSVRWSTGYSETFAHVVGMMNPMMMHSHGFEQLSQTTRQNLIRSFQELDQTVIEAEDKLRGFNFSQMWTLRKLGASGTRKSFDAFSRFLHDFYVKELGSWPPSQSASNQRWLTRTVVQRLQVDCGALYEYLVDRDVEWDYLKSGRGRGLEMTCISKGAFFADGICPVTDILVAFDDSHGLDHIPYPYPLLPTIIQAAIAKKDLPVRRTSSVSFATTEDTRGTIVYERATNAKSLRHGTEENKLLQAFKILESSATIAGITPQEARLGRWILLYGVLQVLSRLSVDISGLRHTKDVDYFLCANLRGCPPWDDERLPVSLTEASQRRSYCFEAPDHWLRDSATRKASVASTMFDEDRRPTLSHLQMSSLLTSASWANSDYAYSPVYEGAAMALPLQYGIRGKLTEVRPASVVERRK